LVAQVCLVGIALSAHAAGSLKAGPDSDALSKDGAQFPPFLKAIADVHYSNYETLVGLGIDFTVGPFAYCSLFNVTHVVGYLSA
jgi:hypothetical protein